MPSNGNSALTPEKQRNGINKNTGSSRSKQRSRAAKRNNANNVDQTIGKYY